MTLDELINTGDWMGSVVTIRYQKYNEETMIKFCYEWVVLSKQVVDLYSRTDFVKDDYAEVTKTLDRFERISAHIRSLNFVDESETKGLYPDDRIKKNEQNLEIQKVLNMNADF